MEIDIGISKKDRRDVADGLSRLLADTYTLYLRMHNYLWNVTGPMFQPLHDMFDEQYKELAEAVDEIAERIRPLDFPAPGTYQQFAELTSIKEKNDITAAEVMIRRAVEGHESRVRTARELFPAAEEVHDEATADLLTQRIQLHEKTAWMLPSMLA